MAKNLEVSLLLDYYGSLLTERQRATAEYYFNDDLSLAEIAELEGVTRQAVRDLVRRTENQLEGFEQKLHFARRISEACSMIRRLQASLDGAQAEKCDEVVKFLMKE